MRVDRLIGDLRAAEPARPSAHRGRQPLTLTDGELRTVVDGLVASGEIRREGHRLRLAERAPGLDPIMRERVAELLAALRDAGPTPPSADAVARRLGIPATLVDQVRAAGELVSVGPRIDYAPATLAEMAAQLDRLAAGGPLSVRAVRDLLGTTRRHAEAILRWWVDDRDTRGVG